jgi:molybdopterin-synthase adenylyltransferase
MTMGVTDVAGVHVSTAHDAFYAELTARNRGLVDERDQQLLRQAQILVAGCGSIGGAVVEPLVRLGAERVMLVEPDVYELHNLNRQQALVADVGRNKATVLAERIRQVNPYVDVASTRAASPRTTSPTWWRPPH